MLYYLSQGRFPSRKAHTIQIMRMCEAFSEVGQATTLIHPSYGGGSVSFSQIHNYYNLSSPFGIKTIPSLAGKNRVPNVPTSGEITISVWLASELLRGRITSEDIIFSRYPVPTWALLNLLCVFPKRKTPTVALEQHQTIQSHPLISESFYTKLDGVVFISEALKKKTIQRYNINPEKTFVAHDAVNLSDYENFTTKQARKLLGIPEKEKVVMYTGHLYEDKQVEELVRAAPHIDASVYIVGGYDEDIERIKHNVPEASEVTFTGFVSPSEIPKYQLAADVLVATGNPEAEYYSPLKFFEYMAASKPIVATRTQASTEIFTENENCIFVSSQNTREMINAIKKALNDSYFKKKLMCENSKKATQHTWKKRAKKILDFVNKYD